MRELALHILDIVENSISADARHVGIDIIEDIGADRLTIRIQDDGRGMDATTLCQVRDPFYTTRTTRHVGLGIPLFAAAAERCAGGLAIESTPGQGATLTATFQHSHIDRAPLGNLPSTLMGILMRDHDFDLHYCHQVRGTDADDTSAFEFDTAEIKQALGDLPLTYPDVREWLNGFLTEGEQAIRNQTASGAGPGA